MSFDIKEVNSIFEQPWWWDMVCPDGWSCAEVVNDNKLIARWPYQIKRVGGFKIITNPPFTQTSGPWILEIPSKRVNVLAREKKILNELIDSFPSRVSIDLTLDSSCEYVLPFRWKGFIYEPTFSYRIKDLNNFDYLFSKLRDNIKSDIRKAERKIKVKEDYSVDVLISLHRKVFERQNRKYPYSEVLVRKIFEECSQRNCCKFLVAVDSDENIHACIFLIYDERVCYLLFTGADSEFRNSGVGSFLIWEGIKFASTVSKQFDFEGSNIEDIERVYRSFGGDFVVNYRIKRQGLIFDLWDVIKPRLKQILGYKN